MTERLLLISSFYWGDAEGLAIQEPNLPSNSSASASTPTLAASVIASEEMINLQVRLELLAHW